MTRALMLLLAIGALIFLAAPAAADWDEGDWAKWVQPPDLNGWDVNFTVFDPDPGALLQGRLADDFPCFETGPITDVHLWFSVQGDTIWSPEGLPVSPAEAIDAIHLSFHKNAPADAVIPWSRPAELLWERDFHNAAGGSNVTIRRWNETGVQGWLEPPFEFIPEDHQQIWQANIFIDAADAFWQQGTSDWPEIYWLDASMSLKPGYQGLVGWKTSIVQWEDDAVYWADGQFGPGWYELRDPMNPERSLDLAFVITPEPGTVAMLVCAGLGLALFGWRRRR